MCGRGGEGSCDRGLVCLSKQGGGAGHRSLGDGPKPAAAGQPSGQTSARVINSPYWNECRVTLFYLIAIKILDVQGSFPAKYYVQNTSRDSCCLDNNYQAFLLVDDGSVGRRGGETGFRAKLEDYISHQRTGIWGET